MGAIFGSMNFVLSVFFFNICLNQTNRSIILFAFLMLSSILFFIKNRECVN